MQWRERMSESRVRSMIVVGVLVVAALLTAAYASSQREAASVILASQAISALARAEGASAPAEAKTRPIEGAVLVVDAYLDSDSAKRLPLTVHVDRAWLAYRVSDQLTILRAEGQTSPAVSSVPGGAEALALFPEIASFVRETAGRRTFANSDSRLSDVLKRRSDSEGAEASRQVELEDPHLKGLTARLYPAAQR